MSLNLNKNVNRDSGGIYYFYIRWVLAEGVGVAGHGLLLALVDVRHDALLVHGGELMLLSIALLLQRLHCLLEALRHLLFEVVGGVRVVLPHVLVALLQVRPILHHLRAPTQVAY